MESNITALRALTAAQAQSEQTISSSNTQSGEVQGESGGGSEFEAFLTSILKGSGGGGVSEEALFAGLVQERLKTEKGEDLAQQYQELFTSYDEEFLNTDGYVRYEAAAKSALKDLRESGALTAEETDQIYSEAFNAAQLDDNAEALWDDAAEGDDPTRAVSDIAAAIAKAEAALNELTAKSEGAALRSVDEEEMGVADAMEALGIESGGDLEAETEIGGAIDGAGGFLFKPVSEADGNLVVLLPPGLEGASLALKDQEGTVLEEVSISDMYEDRQLFRFSKPGAEYPADLVVELLDAGGSAIESYEIADPAQRWD